jgi:acetoin utilization deacetylase AcuC-like enzyme
LARRSLPRRLAREWIERARSRFFPADLPVYYSPAYRLPLSRSSPRAGIELRRADLVTWYLEQRGILNRESWRQPRRARYAELALVHTAEWLEKLSEPSVLARVFAVDAAEINPDALLESVRLGVGATVDAARVARGRRSAAVNLLGGFHHAFPESGGGFCLVNDIAVAIAVMRREGLTGSVVVLDLDAHPPDGTAACVENDRDVWIGSLSASDWGPLGSGVDESVLPTGSGDELYLAQLAALLNRMPWPELAFVIAGGDVLAGDALGKLGLSLAGVRRRDRMVAQALRGIPSVWLPGGGYHGDSWRVLAGSVLELAGRERHEIRSDVDPLGERFDAVADGLVPERLRGRASTVSGEWSLSADDVADLFGPPAAPQRLLGYYSAEGMEYALHAYGVLATVERLGYYDLRVALDRAASGGERVRLLGRAVGRQHTLIECVLEKQQDLLYVHWLTLRDPRARFRSERIPLPGQDVPDLDLAHEAVELLARMAVRLKLAGVAYRPAYFHTAFPAREAYRFVDGKRQGRFLALLDAMERQELPMHEVSRALLDGRVTLNGAPYAWEADVMVHWLDDRSLDADDVAGEKAQSHFSLDA